MALFSSEFKKLGSNMNTSLWKQVELFVSSLSEFKTFEKVDYNFYLIGIISRIKDKLSQIDAPESTEIWKKIEGLCDGLFSNIVNNTPTDKFSSLFTEAIEEVSDSDDIPIRPSLKLISAMYVLAQEYSQISEDNSNYNIFITDWMRSNFVDIKNKWIRNKLVSELVDAYKSTKSTKEEGNLAENEDKQEEEVPEQKDAEEENGWDDEFDIAEVEEDKSVEEEKLEQAQESEANGKSPVKRSESLSFSVNYLFLLQFCNDAIDKSTLKQLVSVDDSILDIVIQGVTSYYKSNKNVYLPLSL
ncbi:uncharacterized protein SPAPADRAFT_58372 [Spathaspora passalidarum NRRL Y-27907]|uniref:Uncharacterized protein n=1 Tax=Spathaspora passalidarum (strain NRRL Y-27907 / 11-Y1) TaxID=619300 RepID=G3AG34_SPAPN|nr:uncharacterized protein SPAPADRAFT_58372 [Spathaspora passalidarum NRRL Y-27907]EGW35173.1 hypothetical protein SPAPADRAFT_58372 [Spathaspora passalidarum NRRL Y-27907]